MLLGDGETSRDIPKVLLPDLLPLLPADDWGLGGLWPAVGGAELRDATSHEPRQLRMEWAATSCIRTWPVLCTLATTVSPSPESGDRMMQVEGSTWGGWANLEETSKFLLKMREIPCHGAYGLTHEQPHLLEQGKVGLGSKHVLLRIHKTMQG